MTDLSHLESVIETAWEGRAEVSPATQGDVRHAVETALALLESGQARVASRGEDGVWTTHQWLKKAVLLSFRLNDMDIIPGGPGGARGAGAGAARARPPGGRVGRGRGGAAPAAPQPGHE